MGELLAWLERAERDAHLHPLLIIGVFAVWFLAIHPFQDGNGRLSRILTTLLLLRHGYSYVPYSSLESVIEENKELYYKALRRALLRNRFRPSRLGRIDKGEEGAHLDRLVISKTGYRYPSRAANCVLKRSAIFFSGNISTAASISAAAFGIP
jgi:hypothetical protein